MEEKNERRQSARFLAKDRAFAVLRSHPTQLCRFSELSMGEIAAKLLKNKPNVLGQIIDISEGGLAFTYLPNGEVVTDSFEMDILFMDDRFFLYRVPYMTIQDIEVTDRGPDGMMPMRRRSIKFGKLHQNQKTQLAYFTANFTKRDIPN